MKVKLKIGDRIKIEYPAIPQFHNTLGTIVDMSNCDYQIKHDKPITWGRTFVTSVWPIDYLIQLNQQLLFDFME